MSASTILVSEVDSRDGWRSVGSTMPTGLRLRWIRALADAGIRAIEVALFVPPKLLPQVADAAEVVQGVTEILDLAVLALAPEP